MQRRWLEKETENVHLYPAEPTDALVEDSAEAYVAHDASPILA